MDRKEFFDSLAGTWDNNCWYIKDEIVRVPELMEKFELKPGMSVLDAATGTGILLPYIFERIGFGGMLVAFDYSCRMLHSARMKMENIGFVQANAQNIPFSGESFDRVICFCAFPHFPDKVKVLKEFLRVLRVGGKFYIAHLTCSAKLNQMHKKIRAVANDCLPPKEKLEGLLLKEGINKYKISEKENLYLAEVSRD